MNTAALELVLDDVAEEVIRAEQNHGVGYHSDHEAFAVLLEEVEEVKAWVWRKRVERDREAMARECVQIAAVAARWAVQLRSAGSPR